ncbi:MAG: ribosome maturation factor RimP [Micromonosporaceae bacterium]|nr:ribosome maturation factor RimP [Micromonosporaceae bacterium]
MRPRRTGPAGPPRRAALADRLTSVIEPVTRRAGFDLERVSTSRVGRRHSVQVVIDGDEGVGLDAIAEVSRAVSEALDAAEESGTLLVPGEYVLEVSSPGVDRPLTEPRHWRRNVGRLVTAPGPEGRSLTGRVVGAGTEAVVLEVEGSPREVPYEQLGPGRVQVELRRPEAGPDDHPGGGPLGEGEAW